ncbi:MAG TPA: hypothetical protein PLY41_07985, partial [Acetomicrobium sp.]|nr:hypothetical protein [Acetomicrobium sp.]
TPDLFRAKETRSLCATAPFGDLHCKRHFGCLSSVISCDMVFSRVGTMKAESKKLREVVRKGEGSLSRRGA